MNELERELVTLAGAIGLMAADVEAELARIGDALDALTRPVAAATDAELERLGLDASTSAIAASVLVLARRIDSPDSSAAEVASCQGRLLRAMEWLRGVAAAKRGKDETETDGVDELARRRDERRRGRYPGT